MYRYVYERIYGVLKSQYLQREGIVFRRDD